MCAPGFPKAPEAKGDGKSSAGESQGGLGFALTEHRRIFDNPPDFDAGVEREPALCYGRMHATGLADRPSRAAHEVSGARSLTACAAPGGGRFDVLNGSNCD